jgi:hypothetical protein
VKSTLPFLLIACAVAVRADVTVNLAASVKPSARGGTVLFTGTLTNTGATEVCLNDAAFAFTGGVEASVTPGTSVFFSNVPGILLPDESYTGELFEAVLNTTAPSGGYSGTFTLKGGPDQLANDTLASRSFSIVSSDVNVTATDATASEYGPEAGVFTVSRGAAADTDLDVPVVLSGTAVNGITYQTIASVVTIPAGAASKEVTVLPIPDYLAQGDRSVTLTVSASGLYNTGASASATLTIKDKPADAWRLEKFGAGAHTPAASDNADWNADGIENQLAFALGLDPVGFNLSPLPEGTLTGGFYQFSWTPNPAAIDMTMTPEASTDLVTWSAANIQPVAGPQGMSVHRYQIPASVARKVYMRLRVSRNGQ